MKTVSADHPIFGTIRVGLRSNPRSGRYTATLLSIEHKEKLPTDLYTATDDTYNDAANKLVRNMEADVLDTGHQTTIRRT